jgi:hypothetical protein
MLLGTTDGTAAMVLQILMLYNREITNSSIEYLNSTIRKCPSKKNN